MKKGLVKKAALTFASLGLSTALALPASAEPPKVDLPLRRIDEGRPFLTRVWDQDTDMYIGIKPYFRIRNGLFGDSLKFIRKSRGFRINTLDYLEDHLIDDNQFDMSALEELQIFLGDLKLLEGFATSGEGSVNVGAGYSLDSGVELHSFFGVECVGDFRFNGLSTRHRLNLIDRSISLDEPQVVYAGAGYYEKVFKSRITIPKKLGAGIKIIPSFEVGYRRRKVSMAYLSLEQRLTGMGNIHYSDAFDLNSTGTGLFFNTRLVVDMQELEKKWLRPIIALEVENIYNNMNYTDSSSFKGPDPRRINIGIAISPGDMFDFRTDLLDVTNSPEIRMEVAKKVDSFEFAIFGRANEKLLMGEKMSSINAYVGVGNRLVNMGIYGSLLANEQSEKLSLAAGVVLNLGYYPTLSRY